MTVTAVATIGRFRRLTLKGDDLGRFAEGGLHVRLLLPVEGVRQRWPVTGDDGRPWWPDGNPPPARVYTLRRIDVAAGEVEIDMLLHADHHDAPGAAFAERARPGDVVGMTGPGGGDLPEAADYLSLPTRRGCRPLPACWPKCRLSAGSARSLRSRTRKIGRFFRARPRRTSSGCIDGMVPGWKRSPQPLAPIISPPMSSSGAAWEHAARRAIYRRAIDVWGLPRNRVRLASYGGGGRPAEITITTTRLEASVYREHSRRRLVEDLHRRARRLKARNSLRPPSCATWRSAGPYRSCLVRRSRPHNGEHHEIGYPTRSEIPGLRPAGPHQHASAFVGSARRPTDGRGADARFLLPKGSPAHAGTRALSSSVGRRLYPARHHTTDDWHTTNNYRQQTSAPWSFLYDEDRVVQKDLDIKEYTDTSHDVMIPHTIVLAVSSRSSRSITAIITGGVPRRPICMQIFARSDNGPIGTGISRRLSCARSGKTAKSRHSTLTGRTRFRWSSLCFKWRAPSISTPAAPRGAEDRFHDVRTGGCDAEYASRCGPEDHSSSLVSTKYYRNILICFRIMLVVSGLTAIHA